MAQTPLFANIAELSALSVFTLLSSRFTVVSVPFKVIFPKTNQLTCHSFTGDLYIDREELKSNIIGDPDRVKKKTCLRTLRNLSVHWPPLRTELRA